MKDTNKNKESTVEKFKEKIIEFEKPKLKSIIDETRRTISMRQKATFSKACNPEEVAQVITDKFLGEDLKDIPAGYELYMNSRLAGNIRIKISKDDDEIILSYDVFKKDTLFKTKFNIFSKKIIIKLSIMTNFSVGTGSLTGTMRKRELKESLKRNMKLNKEYFSSKF